jgi:hypothetical protein
MTTQPADSGKKTSSNFNRQLGLYSLAACAAGVSMLALGQPAAGEVVVTHKTIPIPVGSSSAPEPVKISMANNGINNFSFTLSGGAEPGRTLLVGASSQQDGVIGGGTWDAYAFALGRGAEIGPSPKSGFFDPYKILVEFSATAGGSKYCIGYWGADLRDRPLGCGTPRNKYLGVRFTMDGELHYGWVRLTVTASPQLDGPPLSAQITAYAYETEANTTIYAGLTKEASAELEPAMSVPNHRGPSLGMLALGAEGVPLWRRDLALTSK